MGTLSFCIFDFMTVEVLDSKLVVVSERSRFCPRKMFEKLAIHPPLGPNNVAAVRTCRGRGEVGILVSVDLWRSPDSRDKNTKTACSALGGRLPRLEGSSPAMASHVENSKFCGSCANLINFSPTRISLLLLLPLQARLQTNTMVAHSPSQRYLSTRGGSYDVCAPRTIPRHGSVAFPFPLETEAQ